jgi:dihydrolipoamide dehydrogenase
LPSAACSYTGTVDLDCDLLVLGGGPGGYSAAFRAADLGLKVVLVERYAHLGRRVPERGLHSQQGSAARGGGDGRSGATWAAGVDFGAPQVNVDKLRGHKEKVIGKLTGGLAAMAKMRKVTIVRGYGPLSVPTTLRWKKPPAPARTRPAAKKVVAFKKPSSPRAARPCACPSCPTTRAWWTPPALWRCRKCPKAC